MTLLRLIPLPSAWVVAWTGLPEHWRVFIRLPDLPNDWILLQTRTSDGAWVDPVQGRETFRWDKPNNLRAGHPHFRWISTLAQLPGNPRLQVLFLKAMVRDWNARHPGRKIVGVKLLFCETRGGEAPVYRPLLVWCPGSTFE